MLYGLWAAVPEACMPRAHALQREKPTQGEACELQWTQWRVVPAHHNNKDTAHAAKKKKKTPQQSLYNDDYVDLVEKENGME